MHFATHLEQAFSMLWQKRESTIDFISIPIRMLGNRLGRQEAKIPYAVVLEEGIRMDWSLATNGERVGVCWSLAQPLVKTHGCLSFLDPSLTCFDQLISMQGSGSTYTF